MEFQNQIPLVRLNEVAVRTILESILGRPSHGDIQRFLSYAAAVSSSVQPHEIVNTY